MLGRRGFLGMLAAAVTGASLDPERLLWAPGKKLISIPKPVLVSRTAFDIINTALRMSGVAPNQILSKADTEFSLAALNSMLDGWACERLWPLPQPAFHAAASYSLAVELALQYGRQPDPMLVQMAKDSDPRRSRGLVLSK